MYLTLKTKSDSINYKQLGLTFSLIYMLALSYGKQFSDQNNSHID